MGDSRYIYDDGRGGRDYQAWRVHDEGDAVCEYRGCGQPATWVEHEIDDVPGNYTHDRVRRCDGHVTAFLDIREYQPWMR